MQEAVHDLVVVALGEGGEADEVTEESRDDATLPAASRRGAGSGLSLP
jgi:hypothetical protein